MKSVNWNKNCPRGVGGGVRSNPLGIRSTNRCHAEVRQERQEIREYLDKLRQLVPACPKAGKLSRLSVIQYVIDYIVELQDTLVHHPVNSILGGSEDDISDLASSIHHHTNPIFTLQAINNSKNLSTQPNNTTSLPSTNVISGKNDNNNANSKTTTTTLISTSNNTKKSSSNNNNNNNSNSSTCRRPLGVLSSFKNHRNL